MTSEQVQITIDDNFGLDAGTQIQIFIYVLLGEFHASTYNALWFVSKGQGEQTMIGKLCDKVSKKTMDR